MKRVVYYQEGKGNWKMRIDNVSFFKYLKEELSVLFQIIIPYYIKKIN